MGAVLGLSKSFATSFWFYIVLEGLEAAIGDALSPMFMMSKQNIFLQCCKLNHIVSYYMIMALLVCHKK